ncbi:MAG TPA: 3-deoxy-manno-octulosonate cytidylyltransferase [Marinobacter hydrocarbonoclasticus]|nr:3-deoxy-manno-octulosonate cytidylyltransferase [Marinobacter nauticus]
MSFTVVIPARYASSRLPGKPLAMIAGKPMIQHVCERANESRASRVVVATDDARIEEACLGFGAEVIMTSPHHASGTDRLEEVARKLQLDPDHRVVNVQGDEPLMPVANIQRVAAMLSEQPNADMATLMEPLAIEEAAKPAVVKVVASETGRALYFSRAAIPSRRDDTAVAECHRHIGLYAYRARFLLRFVSWPPAAIEQTESLEQLRALAHDAHIQIELAPETTPIGVDTQEDFDAIQQLLTDGE